MTTAVREDDLPFALLFARPVEIKQRDYDLSSALARVRHTLPTGRRDQILILTTRDDDHADEVVLELMVRGLAVRRIDLDGFPETAGVIVEFAAGRKPARAVFTSPSGDVLLDEIRTVWMRRPIVSLLPAGAPGDAAAFSARRESEAALRGVMARLDHARWVNPPASLWAAESKVSQLAVAASLGFTIPRTLVTSDPTRAREFYLACGGRIIAKAFRGQLGPRGGFQMIHTSRVLPQHLEHADRLRNAPCILQEETPKDAELRVTIIGRQIFSVEIRADSTALDWRDENAEVSFSPTTLDPALEQGCRKLARHWGLASAAIDLIRRPDGQYVFLEINPHNDWLWLEHITGLPMIAAMADLLDGGGTA